MDPQPVGGLVAVVQKSAVHSFESLQAPLLGVYTQPVVALQVSAVQDALSLHAPLSGAFTQPVAGTHESAVQLMPSLQLSAVPGAHCPVARVQDSVPLQRLPSLHMPLPVHCTEHDPAWQRPLLPLPFTHMVPLLTLLT
jgi:hypothetical protein